jgi:thioredoxin-related protein
MITLSLLLTFPPVACGQEVQWHLDLNMARSVAKNAGRPISIDFGTVSCYWCRQLDVTTFRDPMVAKLLAEKVVTVKIDASRDPALAQAMDVHAFPTLIFTAPDGNILGRHEGYADATRFQSQLQKAITQSNAAINGIQPAKTAQTSAPETKILKRVLEGSVIPVAMAPFVLPSPEELGVPVTLNQIPLPREMAANSGTFFARLRQIEAVGFHLERSGTGYRASIDFPGPAIK